MTIEARSPGDDSTSSPGTDTPTPSPNRTDADPDPEYEAYLDDRRDGADGTDDRPTTIVLLGADRMERDALVDRLNKGINPDPGLAGELDTSRRVGHLENAVVVSGSDISVDELRGLVDDGAHLLHLGPDDIADPVEALNLADRREVFEAAPESQKHDLAATMPRLEQLDGRPMVVGEGWQRIHAEADARDAWAYVEPIDVSTPVCA